MPNTREKLIEQCERELANNGTGREMRFVGGDVVPVLANQVASSSKHLASKWIPVTERLPDTAERVLVCKTWLGMVYKPEYGYYQDYPNSKGCWYVLTGEGYYPQREVTHWMPLPEPPKGDNDG